MGPAQASLAASAGRLRVIDAYASWRHYADHLAPVWAALPPEARGRFYAPLEVASWLRRTGAADPVQVAGPWPPRDRRPPVLVASFTDHHDMRPRPTVIVNHGAGQSYLGDPAARGHECFAGGPGRERAILHLEPGPLAGRAAFAAGYRFEMVGSPRLDRWHIDPPRPGNGVVAFGFHHTGRNGPPEQRSALDHYREAVADVCGQLGDRALGHGHPRSWVRTWDWWAKLGVRAEPDFERVLAEADVYVTDNSSTGVEFASTGRPVIWCSAPWYRRGVTHDGRFWDWPEHSLHVERPGALAGAIRTALSWRRSLAAMQAPMVADVFAATDGHAAERAAQAIVRTLAET